MNVIKNTLRLLENDKKKLPGIIFIFLLMSIIDVAGIGLVAPYISFIVDAESQADLLIKFNNLFGLNLSLSAFIFYIGIFIILFLIFRLFAAIGTNALIIRFTESQRLRIKLRLLNNYQYRGLEEKNLRNTSELIYTINTLTGFYSGNVLFYILKITSELFICFLILALLAFQNILVVTFLISLLIFIIMGYDFYVKPKLQSLGLKINFHSANEINRVRETIDGSQEITVLGKENIFHNRVSEASTNFATYQKFGSILSSIPRYLLEFTIFAFIVVVCTFSYAFFENVQEFIPVLTLFGIAAVRLVPSASLITLGVSVIRHNTNTVQILHDDVFNKNSSSTHKYKNISLNKFSNITFSDVNFSYKNNSKEVLKNVSFKINKGDSVALIGSSGSGKSTIANLMMGLIKTKNEDSITINGININESLKSWRSKIAYIPQDIFLIDGTIAQNIALEFDEEHINKEMLQKAIEMSSLHELINSLPNKISENIGEDGALLSGGQRQRIILARAFYHKREFLIMDEATSALDAKTEAKIVKEITELNKDITMVIIAHRLSTIESCNKVIELDDGLISSIVDNVNN